MTKPTSVKYFLLILVVTSFCLQSKAQTNLDSLYNVWQDESKPDADRASAFNRYVFRGFMSSNPDTAIVMAQDLIAFGKKQKYLKAEAFGNNIQATAVARKGDSQKSIEYYKRALGLFRELNDTNGVAGALDNIGSSHMGLGNYDSTMHYYLQSLPLKELVGNKKKIARLTRNIGVVYFYQADYPKSIEYYTRSLELFEELGDISGATVCLNNMAIVYERLGEYPKALDIYERCLNHYEEQGDEHQITTTLNGMGFLYYQMGDLTKAQENFESSLTFFEGIGDQITVAKTLGCLGDIYSELGDFSKALDFGIRGLEILVELGERKSASETFVSVGLTYQRKSDYAKSLDYCKKGLDMALEIGALQNQQIACSCLYETYKMMGKFSKALEYHEKLNVLSDSIYNKENVKKLTELEMQYEFDKKEAATQAEQEKKDAVAAQELKQQKLVRNGFMGGFAVVLMFAGVFFIQRNRIGKEKERSEGLLLNILPSEVAEELKENGSSDAQFIDQVTVLFTDFKGFTALSEQVTPKELVADLHECFSAFDRICDKYGIEKIKTIGDAYMAAGGLPSPNNTHATDVTQAALEMAKVVEDGKAVKQAAGEPFFEIRIGVHTGPVVAGIVGVKKFQYDIWGDTVNTASRMESSGEVGKVNISEATYELLKDDSQFSFESRGKVAAKGKGEMEMYFVHHLTV